MKTRKVQDFVVKGKEVFVGLEDSKKTWKIAVRCDSMLIHRVSMEAKYPIADPVPEEQVPRMHDPSDLRGRLQRVQPLRPSH